MPTRLAAIAGRPMPGDMPRRYLRHLKPDRHPPTRTAHGQHAAPPASKFHMHHILATDYQHDLHRYHGDAVILQHHFIEDDCYHQALEYIDKIVSLFLL